MSNFVDMSKEPLLYAEGISLPHHCELNANRSAGIYVHIPYCARRCLYCDFYTEGVIRADWPAYISALLMELRQRLDGPEGNILRDVERYTLYIGGGTPSLIPLAEFRRLADGIIGMTGRKPAEFTIEVNPDDVTREKAEAWRAAGVDRLSMGVQSLIDSELKFIGRRHDSATAIEAYGILRPLFANISLDLMFGLPGQTMESLRQTLDGFMQMHPDHISAYSLMYEERTALTRLRDSGKIPETDENLSIDMFRIICDTLQRNGYVHYEISNWAIPGRESHHNSAYWQGLPYLGLGAGAHSYDGLRTRRGNKPDARLYTSILSGSGDSHNSYNSYDSYNSYGYNSYDSYNSYNSSYYTTEHLDDEALREEMIMTRLRTRQGLNTDEYARRFGQPALDSLMHRAVPVMARGLLRDDHGHLALTRDGIMLSDDIISELF